MTEGIWIAIVGIVSTIIGSIVTMLVKRKRNNAEVIAMELENAKAVIGMWRELLEKQEQKIDALQQKTHELQVQFIDLEKQKEALINELEKLKNKKQYCENCKKIIEN